MLNIIEAIEEKLKAQKDDIFFKDMLIKDLQERLQAAELEAAEAHKTIDRLNARLDEMKVTARVNKPSTATHLNETSTATHLNETGTTA